VPTQKRFLFPVLVLGEIFRGKMLARLRADVEARRIDLGRADRSAFFDTLYNTRWVVYAKRPFGDVQRVIRYLGRYTHRVGISNARLEVVGPDGVRFRTKEGRHVTLAPAEFLRRFLLHVLPRGFTKIRHYGLLAAGNVHGRLERARALLSNRPPMVPPRAGSAPCTWREILLALTGFDLTMCPVCHERAVVRRALASPPKPKVNDTS
jgi:hypothetical protein